MAKATHKGTCQCCGSVQKLPNGKLSKHGYKVTWGFFQGTCQGSGELPFEQSKALIERFIYQANDYVAELESQIRVIENNPDPDNVWFARYVPASWENRKASYVWEKRGLLLKRVISDSYSQWNWTSKDDDKRDVNQSKTSTGGNKPLLEDAVRFENAKYIKTLDAQIKETENYVKWQEGRINGWTEQPLHELK